MYVFGGVNDVPGGCREEEKKRGVFAYAPTPQESTLPLADENNFSRKYTRIASRTTALNCFREMYIFI